MTSASGFFGGEVVDATLNVDFSNAGLLAHPTGVTFGDLIFQNLGSLVGTPFVNTIDPEIADLEDCRPRYIRPPPKSTRILAC